MRTMNLRFGCRFGAVACWALVSAVGIAADEREDPYVKAPPNHAMLSNTLNGWYFVPKELKAEYDGAMQELEALQSDIDAGKIRAGEAQAELEKVKHRLSELRKRIQSSRVLVEGATIHQQTETIEFEPGPERRLVITANHVRLVGWDGPKIKAELKRMVLSPDGRPVDDHLKAIKIVHVHGRATFAGKTDAEWDAEERKFLSEEGAKLTEQALAGRRQLVDEIRRSYAIHRDYVGKDVDQISVAGLEYENNASITLGAKSEGGDGQLESVRQRYAELTVYVPEQKSICIRGARRTLLVEKVNASLSIVDEDSTDSDPRGRFEVAGVKGDLQARDFPLQKIVDIDGNVAVDLTSEFGIEGAGTMYHDDIRDMNPGRPLALQVQHVTGGVDLNLGRVRLDLREIGGRVNVSNEFGDTALTAVGPLAAGAHRIVSLSGRIDLVLDQAAWSSTPVNAVTNHGGVRTNLTREQFEDFHLVGTEKLTGWRRTWQGFRTVKADEDRFAVFALLDRFRAVLTAEERPDGLDLISRGGRVAVLLAEAGAAAPSASPR